MRNKTTQRLSYIFGISMAVLMAVTLFLPGLAPDTTTQPTAPVPTPTTQAVPTFPPPLTDFSSITFEEDYLHPSGLFAVGVPSGWSPNAPVNTASQALISFNNPDTVSVVEAYVQQPPEPVETADQLSARFDEASLRASWNQYTSSTELSRRVEDERLLIDFELRRGEQQFLARHLAWTDGDWIYVVRAVTPQNARDLLFYLLDVMPDQIQPFKQFDDTPMGWPAYYDQIQNHIFRHPSDWTLVDGGEGLPASFVSEDGTALRVEANETSISDADAATAWVEERRTGNSVTNVETISRTGGEGFSVDYTFTDPDGESRTGRAVLLNGEDGLLHAANALLPEGDVNLDDEANPFSGVGTALETFSLLTGLNLPEPEPEPTPEPIPTVDEPEGLTETEPQDDATEEASDATEEAEDE